MKVLCVDSSPGPYKCAPYLLKEGEVYTASQCPMWPECYKLVEVPINPKSGQKVAFKKMRFIPLDGPDETDIMETRIESEIACLDREFADLFKPA